MEGIKKFGMVIAVCLATNNSFAKTEKIYGDILPDRPDQLHLLTNKPKGANLKKLTIALNSQHRQKIDKLLRKLAAEKARLNAKTLGRRKV